MFKNWTYSLNVFTIEQFQLYRQDAINNVYFKKYKIQCNIDN